MLFCIFMIFWGYPTVPGTPVMRSMGGREKEPSAFSPLPHFFRCLRI
jgi:hypothetical protein